MGRLWGLVISTQNHRNVTSKMLYYLVHLVGRLLRVRGVRGSRVPGNVFAFGSYVVATGMVLPGAIPYGPRAMPHNSRLFLDTPPLYILRRALDLPPRVPSP